MTRWLSLQEHVESNASPTSQARPRSVAASSACGCCPSTWPPASSRPRRTPPPLVQTSRPRTSSWGTARCRRRRRPPWRARCARRAEVMESIRWCGPWGRRQCTGRWCLGCWRRGLVRHERRRVLFGFFWPKSLTELFQYQLDVLGFSDSVLTSLPQIAFQEVSGQ